MALNRIIADSIADGTVIASDIADGTITLAKLQSGILPPAIANSAASYANSAFLVANTPTHVANSAASYANSAFLKANTTVTAANGGTGLTTLTANNVVLGNGTSTVQFVAPGSSGNVLVSNGTTWTSGGAGVTSLNDQTGAVVTTSWDVIGSIASAAANITTDLKPNDTIAGSSLYYPTAFTTTTNRQSEGTSSLPTTTWASGVSSAAVRVTSGSGGAYSVPGGSVSTLTGTWRALSVVSIRSAYVCCGAGNTNAITNIGLFVRVS